MSAPPAMPPRPARGQNSAAQLDAPKMPPRPQRGIDRSVSPSGDRYAPSPLNNPPGPPSRNGSRLSTDIPSRPPSTSMPGLGEEGNEYASFEDLSKTLTNESQSYGLGSPQQTKNIAGDLPLHAPKASVPASTAKNRIQTVTRTDSSQAEAAGFGKLAPEDKAHGRGSARPSSSLGSRPSSVYNEKDEVGIPEIGVQVPMFRNAGDVQAPSPAPSAPPGSSGVGFHNKTSGRHHGRTKSGREIFHGPPGSYGMHGHGKISQDDFEKKWYEKHPDDFQREKAGEYGPHIQENRKDYHWRSENLEQLVHGPGGIGLGTSRGAISTPDEQIGYLATEQYASRYTTPKPQSSGRPTSSKDGTYVDSPLRQEGQPTEREQLDDNGDVIHIDQPAHRGSKIHGGGYDPPTEDLGPKGGNTSEQGGWITERGYGIPILASDEVKKHPDSEWRQPAISPEMERRGDEYTANEDGPSASITRVRSHSRNSSRNGSIQAQRSVASPAQFDRGGTPLESHKEYEPLFPEDEEDEKPKTQVDKLKRPSVARHHFPSQDVWEDTPGSLQLQTTVETPEPPQDLEAPTGGDVSAAKVFEDPGTEEARKNNITREDQQSFLPEHTRRFAAENKLLGKVREEHPLLRPGMQQRFPSQDIWEDAPEHGRLETTVSTPQMEETGEYVDDAPEAGMPTIPARPNVPARPQKTETSPVDKRAPIIPDRPKPQIPVRPSKPLTTARGEDASAEAAENNAPQPKAKPPAPARPGSSKIAALQAGFLQDLNSKLGLGPQAPETKELEPEKETEPAAPLQDARKGRAKGPQRRKPAASAASLSASAKQTSSSPEQPLHSLESFTIPSTSNPHGSGVAWTEGKERILLGPYDYLEAHPGKDIRSQCIAAFNLWLKVPAERLEVITRVVGMLHTASLLVDDVEDSSLLRRGIPVANSIFGVAQTINSANYVYFKALQDLLLMNNPKLVEIFTEELLNLHRGQGMDLYWRDSLTCPSEADYLEMVGNKTGGLFRLAIKLMQAESETEVDCAPLVSTIGLLFQILDDHLNLSPTSGYTSAKGLCEDLTEGKFSFPVIHAIRTDPSNQILINILKQKTTDEEVKRYALRYMQSTGSFDYSAGVINELRGKTEDCVMEIEGTLGEGGKEGAEALRNMLGLLVLR